MCQLEQTDKSSDISFPWGEAGREVISLFSTNERVVNELTRVNLICEIVFIVLKFQLTIASSLYSNTRLYRDCFITMISRFNFVLCNSIITSMEYRIQYKEDQTELSEMRRH